MAIPQEKINKAIEVQKKLQKDLLSKKEVSGISVSTMPEKHDQVCVKVMVSDKSTTAKSLGINESYDGIPVIVSFEEISLM